MTPRPRSSSLPAWRPGASHLPLRGPDFGFVAQIVPFTLLLIAIVALPPRWWQPGLARLGPGEAVWLPRTPDVTVSRWGTGPTGAALGAHDETALHRALEAVARRGDRTGLVLAVEADVPYARVLDVVEAARAAGVRRMYLMASDAPPAP